MKNLKFALVAIASLVAFNAVAADKYPVVSESGIRTLLTNGYHFNDAQAEAIVQSLKSARPNQPLVVRNVLFTSGFDAGFIYDTSNWKLDLAFKDPNADRFVKIPKLFNMKYRNGGLAGNIGYKWIIAFLLDDLTVDQLDGAVFGRGLGLTFDPIVGIDVQYLPGTNRGGAMVIVVPQIGLAGGIRFPKVEFTKANLQ